MTSGTLRYPLELYREIGLSLGVGAGDDPELSVVHPEFRPDDPFAVVCQGRDRYFLPQRDLTTVEGGCDGNCRDAGRAQQQHGSEPRANEYEKNESNPHAQEQPRRLLLRKCGWWRRWRNVTGRLRRASHSGRLAFSRPCRSD